MSMSLVVLLPLILLGIVGTLCFVGCVLNTQGILEPFVTYTTTTILTNSFCIAYWPLKETVDTALASELISNNTGNYIDPTTAPALYPWPSYSIANGTDPNVLSAAAPGTIAMAQASIVAGDVVVPAGDPLLPACMVVNGCYVEVPRNDKFIPKESFSVEAWVRVDWTADDPQAWRFVLDCREFSPATAGFGMFAKADDNLPGVYRWAAVLGDGTGSFIYIDSGEVTITLKGTAAPTTPQYVAFTYDSSSQTLILYVNGEQQSTRTNVGYAPNATQPLWIGAGSPFVPRRPQPAGVAASPLFPFVGAIQDVAIYSTVLAPDAITLHFNNGNGTDPETGG
jgi:hypothetical protein